MWSAGAQKAVEFARGHTRSVSRATLWALLTVVIRALVQLPTWVIRVVEGALGTPPGLQLLLHSERHQ